MKILVFGSREWVDQAPIERELRRYPAGTILVHGACRGADNIAAHVGQTLGFEVRSYPANWGKFGLAAGSRRNQEMLDKEHLSDSLIDEALCFHKDPSLGKGSKDMRSRCEKAGVKVQVFLR